MATNPNTFIGLGMPPELANAVSAAIDAAAGGGGVSWNDVTGKPATFPPEIGTTETTAKAGNYAPAWGDVTGKPATFPPDIGTTASTAMAGDATPTPGDNSVTNAKVAANAAIDLAKLANTAAITTEGGTTIPAGNIQATLQAIADLADPGGD